MRKPVQLLGSEPVPMAPPMPLNDYHVPPPHRHRDLSTSATVAVMLLAVHVVLAFCAVLGSLLAQTLIALLLLATAPAVITWLYRARANVDGIGYRHQLQRAFVIGGWFIPLAFLYLPVRLVLDTWWARLPEERRGRPTALVLVWWACWCLAWFTSFKPVTAVTTSSDGTTVWRFNYSLVLASTPLSAGFLLVAAVALALVVRRITASDQHRT